jgi:SAM-dependent methyltransferase
VQPKEAADTWKRGDSYELYMGRWNRVVAPDFLSWLGIPAGRRWLDVGCGTGTLCAAILERSSPASVVGVEPSEGFLVAAREQLESRIELWRRSAEQLPLSGVSVDVVVSGLVLNFVPEPCTALAEMARVASAEGTVAAYVWDYAGGMELLRRFWDTAIRLDAGAAKLDEGIRFPLCRPEALVDLFAGAGLRRVETAAIDIATPFADFDDYWRPFLGGQGPAPTYVMSLDEEARVRLRERLRNSLPRQADGSIALGARAWAVRGTLASR